MDNNRKTVGLVGATGNFGQLIAQALLHKDGVRVRALVRDPRSERARALAAAGAELLTGDLGDASALARFAEGTSTVISAVQGGPAEIVDGQLAILQAVRAGGGQRFIPSDYSLDFFKLREGENINSDWRRGFARGSDAVRGQVQVVHVLNGCFLDRAVLFGFLGLFDLPVGKAFLWGDGTSQMDFTTYADAAHYTAEAATLPTVPNLFNVAGDTLDFAGLVRAYGLGSGRTLTVESRGSLADLDAEIARRRQAAPGNLGAWLPLMYQRAMLSGRGKLGELANNLVPGFRPLSVAEYVRAEKI